MTHRHSIDEVTHQTQQTYHQTVRKLTEQIHHVAQKNFMVALGLIWVFAGSSFFYTVSDYSVIGFCALIERAVKMPQSGLPNLFTMNLFAVHTLYTVITCPSVGNPCTAHVSAGFCIALVH